MIWFKKHQIGLEFSNRVVELFYVDALADKIVDLIISLGYERLWPIFIALEEVSRTKVALIGDDIQIQGDLL